MNRIDAKFEELKKTGRKAFISFITAGDPTLAKTKSLVKALEDGGSDIIEIGIPYSDPLADGPVIQAASMRAFENADLSVANIMAMMGEVRATTQIPLLFLVYINTILVYGKEKFIRECVEIGMDGLIIPDLPLEEREELLSLIEATDLALIPLVAPTSKDRVGEITKGCKGFVYCVSTLGVTGNSSEFYGGIEDYLADVRQRTSLPIAIGFGISSAKDVAHFKDSVDGIIVGSAIVKKVEEGKGDSVLVQTFVEEMTAPLR